MAKRDAIARLRHDLRTPLNHIVGYTELLKEAAFDSGQPARADELERVLSAAHTLEKLIDENVARGRLEALLAAEPAEEALPAPDDNPAITRATRARAYTGPRGRVLVVDDDRANREVLEQLLLRDGHHPVVAHEGRRALEMLAASSHDLVLLDIMMPELDGEAVLDRMKADPALLDIPVIMISALDEMETVVRCIENGAEGYLSKPFNQTLLRARIGGILERKALRDAERRHLWTIERTQERLAAELAEASAYVRSTVPAPVREGPVRTDWRLLPSTELGGDALGYHWIDDHHFAAYLLDVSGHGVGAALLSATAIKLLMAGALPGVDFRDPGAVLTALNEHFPMESQNNMFFTIWYGVLDRRSRTLASACAGHPPALLVRPDGSPERLGERGLVLGGMPGTFYRTGTCAAPPGSKLFLVSDGAYEIHRDGRTMLDLAGLERMVVEAARAGDEELDLLVAQVRALHGEGPLDDDLSILKVCV